MKTELNETKHIKCKLPNTSIKRQRLSDERKKNQTICSLQEIHFKYKDINMLKAKEKKIIYHANINQKKAGW